mmetsp:Transcript_91898/g.260175  ORF Transcript_91898/g.260175 Transcript_91898/m.260175 type:complete len:253 (-) Transcript_91898:62-820(-)
MRPELSLGAALAAEPVELSLVLRGSQHCQLLLVDALQRLPLVHGLQVARRQVDADEAHVWIGADDLVAVLGLRVVLDEADLAVQHLRVASESTDHDAGALLDAQGSQRPEGAALFHAPVELRYLRVLRLRHRQQVPEPLEGHAVRLVDGPEQLDQDLELGNVKYAPVRARAAEAVELNPPVLRVQDPHQLPQEEPELVHVAQAGPPLLPQLADQPHGPGRPDAGPDDNQRPPLKPSNNCPHAMRHVAGAAGR